MGVDKRGFSVIFFNESTAQVKAPVNNNFISRQQVFNLDCRCFSDILQLHIKISTKLFPEVC